MPSDKLAIHLRVPAQIKARWVSQSRSEGKRLTDWIIEKIDGKNTIMSNEKLNATLDRIIEEYAPKLTQDAHRVYLASIARGYRLMRKYGTKGVGDKPPVGPGFDEWIAGNSLLVNACNIIREAVGNSETQITRRIIDAESA